MSPWQTFADGMVRLISSVPVFNPAENSHLPFCKRERTMQRFVSVRPATRNRFFVPSYRGPAVTIGWKHSKPESGGKHRLKRRLCTNRSLWRVYVTTPCHVRHEAELVAGKIVVDEVSLWVKTVFGPARCTK